MKSNVEALGEESLQPRLVYQVPSVDDMEIVEEDDVLEEDEDSPCSSVLQDGTSEMDLVQSRKRKAPRIPRIYKNDLRRLYSTMLANILNDSDYSKFSSFFDTFCTNTMMVKLKGVGQTLVPKNITYFHEAGRNSPDITFYGVDWVRFHFFSMFRMVADQVFDIKNAKILLKRNAKRSAVVMETEISFSQLYDTTPFAFVDTMFCDPNETDILHHECADASPLGDSLSKHSATRPASTLEMFAPISARNTSALLPSVEEKTDIPDPAILFSSISGRSLPVLSHPRPVSFPSRLMIFLNEDKFIETIVLGTDDSVDIPFSDIGDSSFGSSSSASTSSDFDEDIFY